MGAVAGSSTMKTIAVILVVWAVASARGRTMKDKTTPTPIPPASAEDPDPTQEIARLRAEILEVRKELQATTEVPRWFQSGKTSKRRRRRFQCGSGIGKTSKRQRRRVPCGSKSGKKRQRENENQARKGGQ